MFQLTPGPLPPARYLAKGPRNPAHHSLLLLQNLGTQGSPCPASILPTMAWLLQLCTVLTGHLPSYKNKKRNWLQIASIQVVHRKGDYPTSIGRGCSSAFFLPSVPSPQCSWSRTSTRSRREPQPGNKLEFQSEHGYNHGSLIIHYYNKPLISLCLSFTARVLYIYFSCT